jgi:hypothetical protein
MQSMSERLKSTLEGRGTPDSKTVRFFVSPRHTVKLSLQQINALASLGGRKEIEILRVSDGNKY